jgi:hypothetical protein
MGSRAVSSNAAGAYAEPNENEKSQAAMRPNLENGPRRRYARSRRQILGIRSRLNARLRENFCAFGIASLKPKNITLRQSLESYLRSSKICAEVIYSQQILDDLSVRQNVPKWDCVFYVNHTR